MTSGPCPTSAGEAPAARRRATSAAGSSPAYGAAGGLAPEPGQSLRVGRVHDHRGHRARAGVLLARVEHAELVALGVGEDHPREARALADVGRAGAEAGEAVDLGGLVLG